LVRIASADAPERYDFVVGEDAASLRAEDDGSVTVLDAAGEPVAYVESPWARATPLVPRFPHILKWMDSPLLR